MDSEKCQSSGCREADFVCRACLCLWTSRNQARVGGDRKLALQIFQWPQTYPKEFQIANFLPPQSRSSIEHYWIPPKPPWHKVNVDGAVFSNLKAVGLGLVVQDHRGNVAAAMSKFVGSPFGPLETEAKAIGEAVSLPETQVSLKSSLRVIRR
ncbi:uncharacterized protein LOC126705008 [Quercus robur]|uniref:uncharacterized protein LOC126705008 n=1 Tax=Quercus robur TaxID=38942 RepID=UPI002163B88E|nr:uncharacterized protein LOC126705008 [Quercus robur]